MFHFLTTSLLWLSAATCANANPLEHRRDQVPLIVGGSVTSLSNYPYFVSLSQGCGATLIHEDIALSAAHCDSGSFNAIVGPSRTNAAVASKVVHPSYSASSFRYDFMVLKLDRSFPSISLPNVNSNGGTPSGSQDIVVVGYGATSEGGAQSSDFREVTLQHVAYDQCNTAYNGDIEQGTMFCAGVDGGGKDSCQGDSGGPLLIGNNLVGVVSWGIGCARDEYPGVNARVSAVSSWIDNWVCCLSSAPPSGCSCEDDTNGGGNAGPGACFSGDDFVHTEEKGNVLMSDLQIGDRVLTSNSGYEPIYAFGHHHETKEATFVKFSLAPDSWLEMTGAHLIYVLGKSHPIRADSVEVGDNLVGRGKYGLQVTKIEEVNKEGIYGPLTASGKIVVNNVLASSYISLQENADEYVQLASTNTWLSQASISHMWMTPLRILCTESNQSLETCHTLDRDGLSPWVALGFKYAAWGKTQNIYVQVIILLVTLVGLIITRGVEVCLKFSASACVLISLAGFLVHRMKEHFATVRFGSAAKQKVV